jgi:hypothetical protein
VDVLALLLLLLLCLPVRLLQAHLPVLPAVLRTLHQPPAWVHTSSSS